MTENTFVRKYNDKALVIGLFKKKIIIQSKKCNPPIRKSPCTIVSLGSPGNSRYNGNRYSYRSNRYSSRFAPKRNTKRKTGWGLDGGPNYRFRNGVRVGGFYDKRTKAVGVRVGWEFGKK